MRGIETRHLGNLAVALVLAATCVSAHAQFGGFSLPGLGKGGGDKGRGLDVGSVVGNLTKAVKEPDEAEEIRIGQEFAATLLGAKPLAADPALQRYINVLGRWLALQTERPDLP